VSKAKALEILSELRATDKLNVDDYNNNTSWSGYSIERHLSLTAFRLNHLAGGVFAAIEELAKDEQPQPGPEGQL
jgi:hypothetical protein